MIVKAIQMMSGWQCIDHLWSWNPYHSSNTIDPRHSGTLPVTLHREDTDTVQKRQFHKNMSSNIQYIVNLLIICMKGALGWEVKL